MTSLRLAFMGTPDFSVPTLQALAEAGHEIVGVYTQPPRPAGRGQRERLSPVHSFALEQGWPVFTPGKLKDSGEQAAFVGLDLDAAVVVAYGLILPKAILDAPRLGCFNVHASLLPRWRGAAPIQRAILAGDKESGVSIMAMAEGLDTGPVYSEVRTPITDTTTASDLHDRLAVLGAAALVETLDRLLREPDWAPVPQDPDGVTYAAKLTKEEGRMDWRAPAAALERRLRAFTPWPGGWFDLNDEKVKIIEAECALGSGAPGTVLDENLTIACGEGALRLTKIQRAGKRAMAAEEFLRGYDLPKGTLLPCPATS